MGEARFASSFQGPLNFVAGLYYQREDNDFEVIVTTTDGMGGPVPWDPANANDALTSGGTAFFGRFRQDEKEQKAAFGEVTFDVTDQLNVLLGMRVFDAESTSIQATTHGFGGQVAPGAGEVIGTTVNGNGIGLLRADGNTVNPKVSLSYRYSDKLMVYGLYSEGFRVGGINNGDQPFVPGIPETFNSDELKNYEIGIKSLWLNDSLRLNATAFFIDWDIQVEPRDPLGAVPFITNGGTAEVSGLEWSVNWLPSEKWDLLFSGTAFSDAQLTEDQPILPGASPFILTGLEGDEIPNIASLQWFASAKYNARLFNKPLALIADITFRGDTDTEFRKDSPFNIHLESYVINDIYANWEYSDNVILGVFVKNVWDELAIQDGINTMQDPTGLIAARPLTFGAKVTWKFD
jgi:outer membrane receptor protein involved in Fe transport